MDDRMRERMNVQKQVEWRTREEKERASLWIKWERWTETRTRTHLHAKPQKLTERERQRERERGGASSLDAIRRVKPSSTTTHKLTAEFETVNEPERLQQLNEAEWSWCTGVTERICEWNLRAETSLRLRDTDSIHKLKRILICSRSRLESPARLLTRFFSVADC